MLWEEILVKVIRVFGDGVGDVEKENVLKCICFMSD